MSKRPGQDEDAVFKALADAHRRRMLDLLRNRPGMTVGELCAHFSMSRIGAMKHLNVLEGARLVVSEPDGRIRRLYLNAVPIQQIHDRWTTEFSAHFARGLTALKRDMDRRTRR